MMYFRTTLTLVALASLAMTASARHHHKHQPKRAPAASHALAYEGGAGSYASPESRPLVGTWTLRDGDRPRTDIRMVFRGNGTFAFVGPNWQSTGKFRKREHKLCLEWTSIDGSKVAPGTVKKDYPMAEDDSSFTIDKYTYYKLNR